MDTSYSYQDSLHLLNNSEWSKLPLQNRAAALQSIENEVARREGRPPCNVSLFSEKPKENGLITAGTYKNGVIGINTYHLAGSPEGCLNTLLHEGRHAYQDCAVKGEINHNNKAELRAWQDNMRPGHYINANKNPRAYYRQPIEADAREYADITTRQILAEQKIQNNTNKGINSFLAKSSEQPETSSSTNKGIQSFRDKASHAENNSTTNAINDSKSTGAGQSSGNGQRR